MFVGYYFSVLFRKSCSEFFEETLQNIQHISIIEVCKSI